MSMKYCLMLSSSWDEAEAKTLAGERERCRDHLKRLLFVSLCLLKLCASIHIYTEAVSKRSFTEAVYEHFFT